MVLCGIFEGKVDLPLTELVRGRKRLLGSHTYEDSTWFKIVDLFGRRPVNCR